jgi:hypothetical protein
LFIKKKNGARYIYIYIEREKGGARERGERERERCGRTIEIYAKLDINGYARGSESTKDRTTQTNLQLHRIPKI